jgi:putative transposase
LFQGPFRSAIIDSNAYLLQVSKFIHLNPVQAGLVDRPEEWKFSSYTDYIGQRKGKLISVSVILSQFSCGAEYAAFVCNGDAGDTEMSKALLLDLE